MQKKRNVLARTEAAERHALRTMKHCEGRCQSVPQTVKNAVYAARAGEQSKSGGDDPLLRSTEQVAFTMMREGWRFCFCFRHEETKAHADLNAVVYTTGANHLADDMFAHARLFTHKTDWTLEEMASCSVWWINFKREIGRLTEQAHAG